MYIIVLGYRSRLASQFLVQESNRLQVSIARCLDDGFSLEVPRHGHIVDGQTFVEISKHLHLAVCGRHLQALDEEVPRVPVVIYAVHDRNSNI